MLTSIIVRIVRFCIFHAWTVVGVALLIAVGSSVYTASHFRLNSNVNALLSDKLDWRQRGIAFESAFGRFGIIDVVVKAPTPELTGAATVELTQALAKEKALFPDVSNAGATEFFAQHGLLFLPKQALEKALGGLIQGEALIRGSRLRPKPARADRGARGRASRPSVQSFEARGSRPPFESGVRYAGQRARGAAGEFLVARLDARQARGRRTIFAASSRSIRRSTSAPCSRDFERARPFAGSRRISCQNIRRACVSPAW